MLRIGSRLTGVQFLSSLLDIICLSCRRSFQLVRDWLAHEGECKRFTATNNVELDSMSVLLGELRIQHFGASWAEYSLFLNKAGSSATLGHRTMSSEYLPHQISDAVVATYYTAQTTPDGVYYRINQPMQWYPSGFYASQR